jgi:hypothetical protein
MAPETDGRLAITTRSREAAASYREGLTLLIASSPEARDVLAAAIAVDDQLAVAHAALAVVLAGGGFRCDAAGAMSQATRTARLGTRRERQHVEIIGLLLGGDGRRAHALGAEHLLDFAGDRLIDWLITR